MAEKSLEEVRAWKRAAAKELEGLTPAEIVKKVNEAGEAYRKKHGLDLEVVESPDDSPGQTVMRVPKEIVPQVQKLIDEYEKQKAG